MNEFQKLNKLIDKSNRIKILILSFLLFVSVILELISIASIYPFIDLVLNSPSTYIDLLYKYLNIKLSNTELIYSFSLLIVSLFMFKTFYNIYLNYRLYRFIQGVCNNVLLNLHLSFFEMPFRDFVNKNSGELYRNFDTEIKNFSSYFEALLISISETILILTLLTTLLILNPIPTLVMFVIFFLLGFTIYNRTKIKIENLGKKLRKIDINVNKLIFETITGYKEITFFKKNTLFNNILKEESTKRIQVISNFKALGQVPKALLELVAITGKICYSLISFFYVEDKNLLFNLSLLVATSFKIIPSVNRIILNLQILRYNHTSIDLLYQKIKTKIKPRTRTPIVKNILLKDVFFGYNNENILFENFNLNIETGETTVIYGNSGSGKSTLLKILTGLIKPYRGDVLINGKKNILDLKGYVNQDPFLFDQSILFNITFEKSFELVNKKRLKYSLELSNVIEFFNPFDINLDDKYVGENGSKLSGGQRQRIAYARAIYNNSDVYLFDEPTSSLAKANVEVFIKSINELNKKGKTIILVTHSHDILDKFSKKLKL